MSVFEELRRLGVTFAEFSRRCNGIGYHTVERIDGKDPRVKPVTIARVQRALRQIKAELEHPKTIGAQF